MTPISPVCGNEEDHDICRAIQDDRMRGMDSSPAEETESDEEETGGNWDNIVRHIEDNRS